MKYKFWGKVRKHNQRGKKLGFPTANVSLHKVIPEGIYVSFAKVNGRKYQALTFIGRVKTFNEKLFHSETFILDFEQNLYGKWIIINLLKKLRPNKKFKSAAELITQMQKDKAEARKYFYNLAS